MSTCVTSVYYFEQDETVALKKISSKVSRDVRKFWLKINKVVAFKQKIDSDEVRQKVSDFLCGCINNLSSNSTFFT